MYRVAHASSIEEADVSAAWLTRAAACFFVLLAFFPNPGIPLGGETGLQFNQLIALGLVPWILLRRPPMVHLAVVAAMFAMVVVCGFIAMVSTTSTFGDLVAKMLVLLMLAVVVMIPAGYFASHRNMPAILLAVSLAILINVVMGFYQIMSFSNSVFPFPWLYNNPSFASMAEDTETYVMYIRRPFGFFPEPSAMGASLGPWIIVLVGLILRGSFPEARYRKLRWLMIAAAVFGSVLMFQARSGYTAVWLATLLPVVLYYGLAKSKPGLRRVAKIFFGSLVGLVVVVIAWNYVNSNLNAEAVSTNDSWASRQQSIVIALTAPSRDPLHFLFGYGPGQAATFLQSSSIRELLPSWYSSDVTFDIPTVWSVLGTIYMENGLIGLIVIGGMVTVAVRAIHRSPARVIGYCTLVAWILGTTIATSYFPLSPIWILFALLLVWDRLFQTPGPGELAAVSPVHPESVAVEPGGAPGARGTVWAPAL